MSVLHKIAGLTPRRVYYPQDLKVMRTDTWIDSLPIILQHSAYRQIVDRILQESATLGMFAAKEQSSPFQGIGIYMHERCFDKVLLQGVQGLHPAAHNQLTRSTCLEIAPQQSTSCIAMCSRSQI
ncbi:hypothetical protein LB505_005615 [Fusarium chuoi]|nr:hypothetical protein LB505_005615 [Fusarium chuoi]